MKTLTFDIETYVNYTLFALRDIDSHKLITFEIRGKKKTLSKKDTLNLKDVLNKNKIITYNGLKFDEPITAYALKGKTAKEIFNAVQKIIVDGQHAYQFYRMNKLDKIIPNHIDIMDVARGSASLKLYGARLDTKKLQDLPYEPTTKLKSKQMDEVLKYCENDNILTEELYRYLAPDLELREAMSAEYNVNLMSFKGAKIADIVLAQECDYTGKAPEPPEFVKVKIPKYIKFKTKKLKDILKKIKKHKYNVTETGGVEFPEFAKEKFMFADMEGQLGNGGYHSSVSSKHITKKDDELIVEIDFASLYPNLIIKNNFAPQHLGNKFIEIYSTMLIDRKKAKTRMGEIKKEIEALEDKLSLLED